MTQFKRDYEEAINIMERIETMEKNRVKAAAEKQSTSNVQMILPQFDTQLRGQIDQAEMKVKALEQMVVKSKSGISEKEKEKCKAKVTELRQRFNFLRDGIVEKINANSLNVISN